jgi:hypothetical protein
MNADKEWILCSGKPPDPYEEVFVTIEENNKRYATIGHMTGNGLWNTLDVDKVKYTKNVVAWSPFENVTKMITAYNGK